MKIKSLHRNNHTKNCYGIQEKKTNNTLSSFKHLHRVFNGILQHCKHIVRLNAWLRVLRQAWDCVTRGVCQSWAAPLRPWTLKRLGMDWLRVYTSFLHQFLEFSFFVFLLFFFALMHQDADVKDKCSGAACGESPQDLPRFPHFPIYIYLYSNKKKKKGGMTRTKRPEWGNREVWGGGDVGVELASDNNFGNWELQWPKWEMQSWSRLMWFFAVSLPPSLSRSACLTLMVPS